MGKKMARINNDKNEILKRGDGRFIQLITGLKTK
jgi:hypothetical protein